MEKLAPYLILLLFVSIPILQFILYIRIDSNKIKKSKSFITIIILFIYFLFPFLINFLQNQREVISDSKYIETKCLLPVVSLFLGLWIMGLIITLITSIFYIIYRGISNKIKT
ncbi:hypothetical protein ABGT15_05760 [Flavobacterium enshiense]|uniref:hypothetical protein n=1 Tax=Flavobacterium enshiense TaxID=1341165 RepID=UPI00345D82C7